MKYFKGSVESSDNAEYGRSKIEISNSGDLLKGISKSTNVWMSHGDKVTKIPDQWNVTSKSENNVISSSENSSLNLYGVQFHPEVIHTDEGKSILSNFLFDIE